MEYNDGAEGRGATNGISKEMLDRFATGRAVF